MLVGVDCRVANVEAGIAHEVGSERRRGACHLWLAIPSYCGHWWLWACADDGRDVGSGERQRTNAYARLMRVAVVGFDHGPETNFKQALYQICHEMTVNRGSSR